MCEIGFLSLGDFCWGEKNSMSCNSSLAGYQTSSLDLCNALISSRLCQCIFFIIHLCLNRYGIKHYTPDPATEKRRRRMLKKYPLPSTWREVPDGNLDRCYYWNLETDEVSWLPPSHPRSHITQSAIKIRRKKKKFFEKI
jgi:hypothetical protein